MRIAAINHRTHLVTDEVALDVERASDGRFAADPQALWADIEAFTRWAADVDVAAHADSAAYDVADLGVPVPAPSQIFAIGLNYADHAAEIGAQAPEHPVVFTKFASSMTGAVSELHLSGDRVDWEAEMILVIGRGGRDIDAAQGWDHVAGMMVGQDLTDRTIQTRGGTPQFSMGKSFAGYAPVGPWVTTVDEVRAAGHDVDALSVRCTVAEGTGDGAAVRTVQDGTTASMVFSVCELIARLSATVELRPGDLVWTGTPAGCGAGQDPQVFLTSGQVVTTEIAGLGTLRQTVA